MNRQPASSQGEETNDGTFVFVESVELPKQIDTCSIFEDSNTVNEPKRTIHDFINTTHPSRMTKRQEYRKFLNELPPVLT